MLHIMTPLSHASGVPQGGPELDAWDLVAEVVRIAKKNLDESLGRELENLIIRPVLSSGAAAPAILRIAQKEEADLIMLPSHGHTFDRFLLGSVTANVLRETECPVWTDAHVRGSQVPEFAIRSILCAIDFTAHGRKAVSWAAHMAAEFGARLTLAHVTAGVELWGPGGNYVNPEWRAALVGDASQRIAQLQQDMGIKAEVFIGSGDARKVLSQAVTRTKADLVVNGCYPYGGNLRIHGYAIISAVPIPVLSV